MQIEPAVKNYLAAIGAAAIYVSVDSRLILPVSVGCTRKIDQTVLTTLRKRTHRQVSFGWLAWSQDYDKLMQIAKDPDVMWTRRFDGARVIRGLSDIVLNIEHMAKQIDLVLTPHAKVVERATVLAAYVNDATRQLRESGKFHELNRAYRDHRIARKAEGGSAQPYWLVMERLQRVLIKSLIENPRGPLSLENLIQRIRVEFPWFAPEDVESQRQRA